MAIERRTCKHLRKLRGDAVEDARVGSATRGTMSGEGADGTAERKADDEAKAPPLLLAHPWENDVDLTGWWMSEKLDGVRAYWTGKHFLSRLGNVYHAPDWFLAGLPEVPLDGELWCGRKKFQRCVSVVRRQDKSEHWRELTYVVFDAPAMKAPFEERLAFVEERMQSRTPPHAQHHARIDVASRGEARPHSRSAKILSEIDALEIATSPRGPSNDNRFLLNDTHTPENRSCDTSTEDRSPSVLRGDVPPTTRRSDPRAADHHL